MEKLYRIATKTNDLTVCIIHQLCMSVSHISTSFINQAKNCPQPPKRSQENNDSLEKILSDVFAYMSQFQARLESSGKSMLTIENSLKCLIDDQNSTFADLMMHLNESNSKLNFALEAIKKITTKFMGLASKMNERIIIDYQFNHLHMSKEKEGFMGDKDIVAYQLLEDIAATRKEQRNTRKNLVASVDKAMNGFMNDLGPIKKALAMRLDIIIGSINIYADHLVAISRTFKNLSEHVEKDAKESNSFDVFGENVKTIGIKRVDVVFEPFVPLKVDEEDMEIFKDLLPNESNGIVVPKPMLNVFPVRVARAKYDFSPDYDDDIKYMSLRKGSIVYAVEEPHEDWTLIANLSNEDMGYVPTDFLTFFGTGVCICNCDEEKEELLPNQIMPKLGDLLGVEWVSNDKRLFGVVDANGNDKVVSFYNARLIGGTVRNVDAL